jgi:hypothetical protein
VKLSFSFVLILWSALSFAGEAAKPPAPTVPPKAGTPAAPAAGKAAAPAAPKPVDPADTAPVKNLDEGGVLFSPSIAKNVRKYLTRKGTDKHEVIFIGPGIAGTEKAKLMPPSGSGWTFKSGPESVTKAAGTGLELLEELPGALSGFQPGIVVIVGVAGRPKFLPTDKQDWNDVATLCLRYGAIPILAIPASTNDDDPLRWSLRGASSTVNVPAVDTRAGTVAERLPSLLKLIETHVYGASTAAKNAEPVDE